MIKVGIDFSLNSTAVCINNRGFYTFYNFINADRFLNKKGDKALSEFKIHEDIKSFVSFVFCKRGKLPDDYSKTQIQKINDYDELTDKIVSIIPKESKIGLEGFSYSSSGRSDIDLIMAQTILRYKLIKNGFSLDVISPSTIKKEFTGNGNANKLLMLESFKKENLDLDLYKYIIDNIVIKKSKVLKPIDDIIDAYAISKLI